ncbi:Hypothetical protein PHPALM_5248 [Phytophthora palmivora]|uniref:ATP-binding cassette (ABC) Superfamily n=1 Tax=Phytophthora palmivora TaxID=4796 RepID=A0A2P4YHT2_9STRA|nr:Hypothetical protein PHPALM_5248 [Phytophthora palmivora]
MGVPSFKMNHSLSTTSRPLGVYCRHEIDLVPGTKCLLGRPENATTQTQAEDLFWRWVSRKNVTVQELKELREDRLLYYVLGQFEAPPSSV